MRVFIYKDIGCSIRSVQELEKLLLKRLGIQISHLSADELLELSWMKNAAALFMPGGADLQYAVRLNGRGNEIIRNYVENGGKYIGICAGAYYGSNYCDFHRNNPRPGYEVLGLRELSFYPGAAVGPVLGIYEYNSDSGARTVVLQSHDSCGKTEKRQYLSYVNGGCYFPGAENMENTTVLYTYQGINDDDGSEKAAIIENRIGKGLAILSGPHFEFNNTLIGEIDQRHTNECWKELRTNEELSLTILKRLFTTDDISESLEI